MTPLFSAPLLLHAILWDLWSQAKTLWAVKRSTKLSSMIMKVTTWMLLNTAWHCDQQQLKEMSSTDFGSPAVCFCKSTSCATLSQVEALNLAGHRKCVESLEEMLALSLTACLPLVHHRYNADEICSWL